MPVKAIIGRPRQGKSYSIVKNVMLPALRKGRPVVTDIVMKPKAHDEFGDLLIFEEQIDYDNIKAGSIYIIDEFWKECAKGVTPLKVPHKIKHLFAMHGHDVGENGLTTELILIFHNYDQICDYVAGLVDKTYYVQKIKLSGNIEKCKTTEYDGVVKGNPPRGKPDGTKLDTFDSEIFEYYKSHTGKGAKEDEGVIEMDAIKAKTLLDYPLIKYGLPALVIGFPVLTYFAYSSLKGMFSEEPIEQQQEPTQQQTIQTEYAKKEQSIQAEKALELKKSYDYFDELDVFPMSKNMRITGIYNYSFNGFKKQGVQLTIMNQKTLDIPMQNVRIDGYGEYFVVYRNEIVTRTTGEPPIQYTAYLPDGDASPEDTTQEYFDNNNKVRGNRE